MCGCISLFFPSLLPTHIFQVPERRRKWCESTFAHAQWLALIRPPGAIKEQTPSVSTSFPTSRKCSSRYIYIPMEVGKIMRAFSLSRRKRKPASGFGEQVTLFFRSSPGTGQIAKICCLEVAMLPCNPTICILFQSCLMLQGEKCFLEPLRSMTN